MEYIFGKIRRGVIFSSALLWQAFVCVLYKMLNTTVTKILNWLWWLWTLFWFHGALDNAVNVKLKLCVLRLTQPTQATLCCLSPREALLLRILMAF